ncbi:uncharacterized protein LOC118470098 isoform X2 [Amphiprion ocellaris]|nr:uncharacterized protein LOC118470098 isoform X2 [Amphiprion ocellaris]
MTERRRRRRKSPDQDAVDHIVERRDKPFLEGKFISTFKGRGVFTQEYIAPQSFVVEYRGILSPSKGLDDKNNHYLFDFMWNGQHYCIDALKDDGTLGRLVNDDHINPNCKVKKIVVKGRPHLCLFALKEIFPGEEITYNYGDSPWPWRSMAHFKEPCTSPSEKEMPISARKQKAHFKEPCTSPSEKEMPTSAREQKKLLGATGRHMTEVIATPGAPEDEDAHFKEPCTSPSEKEMPTSAREQKKLLGATGRHMTEVIATPGAPEDEDAHFKEPCTSPSEKEMPTSAREQKKLLGATGRHMTEVIATPGAPEDEDAHFKEPCTSPSEKEMPTSAREQKKLLGATGRHMTEVIATPGAPEDEDAHFKEPCTSPSEKEMPTSAREQKKLLGATGRHMTEVIATPGAPEDEDCLHKVTCAVVSSLERCEACRGRPFSNLKWLGVTCQLCSKSWHKSCFFKRNSTSDDRVCDSPESSDGCFSDKDYVPCSSDGSSSEDLWCTSSGVPASSRDGGDPSSSNTDPSLPRHKARAADLLSSKKRKKKMPQPIDCMEQEDRDAFTSGKFGIEKDLIPDSKSSDDDPTTSNTQSFPTTATDSLSDVSVTKTAPAPKGSSCTEKNYCYVCKTPQSKIARHLKKHEKEEPAIAEVFLLPKNSKERKRLLEKLRNKGNYEHNQEVLAHNDGLLKVKRRSKQSKSSLNTNNYVHCAYCKGMFVRKELWRHSRKCPSKTMSESEAVGKAKCLALADIAESTCTQAISPGVWKVLKNMRQDEVGSVVRNDFLILQLSQSLYNKHGSDPTKFEYMRQKVREMGRLLLTLRKEKSIFSFEDATKPKNFYKVIAAVRTIAGYDEEKNCYRTPSLALKLGHSLKKIGDIILCRAIAAEDEQMIKAAERFTQLCTKEWAGLVSHTALASLSKSKFNKPSTLPFTEDVQRLHQYLEKKSADAVENLKEHTSPQSYGELARVTLTQIIIFNRRRAGEVSKMTLESFEKRDQTELHVDIAAGLSQFEQTLARHFSRVEIMGKRGRKVTVLLNPEVLTAATLLVDKRDTCNVHKDNPFLFGRPQCSSTSHYRGQDCIRKFAHLCGAKNPQYLRSTQLRKHVATLSQILNLKDNELDQLANFLGHDIRVHRDFYRLPEATIEMARISKLLLAMEKGSLAEFQGKSLHEIEIEAELDPELDEGEQDDENDDDKEGGGGDDDGGGGDDDGGGGDDDGGGGDDDGGGGDDDGGGGDDGGGDGDIGGGDDDDGSGDSNDGGGGGDNDDGGDDESDRALGLRGKRKRMELTKDETKAFKEKRKRMESTQDEASTSRGQKNLLAIQSEVTSSKEVKSRRCVKKPWRKNEVSAVMKHFKTHISKGHLATKLECEQCKRAEHAALRDRTTQNIRDFVRNRGLMVKRKSVL